MYWFSRVISYFKIDTVIVEIINYVKICSSVLFRWITEEREKKQNNHVKST